MNSLALFPTYIFGKDYCNQVDNQKIINYCYQLKITHVSQEISNRGGWQSPPLVSIENFEVENLINLITVDLSNIYKQLSISRKPNLANYWVNINPPWSYNERHSHTLSLFSCVYYVKVPKDSGDFVIERSDESKFFLQYFEKENDFSAQAFSISPTDSKLILFPSWTYHSVGQNRSNEDRISIAFNFI